MSPVETRLSAPVAVGPSDPSTEMMLDAMRRENEQLRTRLVETERDYIRITRLNEIYREELIDHRRRVSTQPADATVRVALRHYYDASYAIRQGF